MKRVIVKRDPNCAALFGSICPDKEKGILYVYGWTEKQTTYIDCMRYPQERFVFAVGPAATGKTLLAVALALEKLNQDDQKDSGTKFKKVIFVSCRPSSGKNTNVLPTNVPQHLLPHVQPLYYACKEIYRPEDKDKDDDSAEYISSDTCARKWLENKNLEVMTIEDVCGRNIEDSFVIVDDVQYTTKAQMRMLLTRTHKKSKIVFTGDPEQVDLPEGKESGLQHALELMEGANNYYKCPNLANLDFKIISFDVNDTVTFDNVVYRISRLLCEKKE